MIISVFQMRNCDSQSLDKLLKITSLVNDMESVKFSLLPAECKGFSTNKTQRGFILWTHQPLATFCLPDGHSSPLTLYPPRAGICLNHVLVDWGWTSQWADPCDHLSFLTPHLLHAGFLTSTPSPWNPVVADVPKCSLPFALLPRAWSS